MRAFSACNSLGSIRLDAKVHRESLPNQSSHSRRGEIQQPANRLLAALTAIPAPERTT